MKLSYYKNLDGIRAIAALMVMFYHFFEVNHIYFISDISSFGQTGVTLFFVLSGFLITRILLSTKDSKDFFKRFYLNRVVRIFPLYFLFLFIHFFIYPIFSIANYPTLFEQVCYYFYFQNYFFSFHNFIEGPLNTWSLAIEEQFYLFWPLIVYNLKNIALKYIIILIVILSFILRIYFCFKNYEPFYFTFTRIDSLAIGSIGAIYEFKLIRLSMKKNIFLLILFYFIYLTAQYFFSYFALVLSIEYLTISFFYLFLILLVINIKSIKFVDLILQNRFLILTGKISYGLYIYHTSIYTITQRILPNQSVLVSFIFWFGSSFLISYISYNYFEKYFFKFKYSH